MNRVKTERKGLQPSDYKSLCSISPPGFDSLWEQFSSIKDIVILVVADVPVDNEAPLVILSISRIFRLSLRRYSQRQSLYTYVYRDGFAYVVSVALYRVIRKKKRVKNGILLCARSTHLFYNRGGLRPLILDLKDRVRTCCTSKEPIKVWWTTLQLDRPTSSSNVLKGLFVLGPTSKICLRVATGEINY